MPSESTSRWQPLQHGWINVRIVTGLTSPVLSRLSACVQSALGLDRLVLHWVSYASFLWDPLGSWTIGRPQSFVVPQCAAYPGTSLGMDTSCGGWCRYHDQGVDVVWQNNGLILQDTVLQCFCTDLSVYIYNDLIISKQLTLATCRPAGSAWTVSGLGRFVADAAARSLLRRLKPQQLRCPRQLACDMLVISRNGKPWERENVSTGNFPWKAPGCPRLHPAHLIGLPQVLPQQRPWAPQQPQQPLQLPRLQQPQPPQQWFPEHY